MKLIPFFHTSHCLYDIVVHGLLCQSWHNFLGAILEIIRPNPSRHIMDTSNRIYSLYASKMEQIANHPALSAVSVTGGEQTLI